MGEAIRFGKRLRVAALPKGLRVSAGPRRARVHVGGGVKPSVSTGVGPVTVWRPVGGKKRTNQTRPAGTASSAKAVTVHEPISATKQVLLGLLGVLLVWPLNVVLSKHQRGLWGQPLLIIILIMLMFDWALNLLRLGSRSDRLRRFLRFVITESLWAPLAWGFYKALNMHGQGKSTYQGTFVIVLSVLGFYLLLFPLSTWATGSLKAAHEFLMLLVAVGWLGAIGGGLYLVFDGLLSSKDGTTDIVVGVFIIIVATVVAGKMVASLSRDVEAAT